MNFKYVIALVAVMLFSLTATAQIHTSTSSKITRIKEKKLVLDTLNYNRISAGLSLTYAFDPMGGGELDYVHGFHLSQKNSLFLELGLRASFEKSYNRSSFWNDGDMLLNRYMFSLYLPINATYKIKYVNGIYISPYMGPHLRVNIIGMDKMEFNSEKEDVNETLKFNLFDSKETYHKRNRVQFGGQVGLNIGYKFINIGLGSYIETGQVSEIYNLCGGISATIGVNF